MLFQPKDQVMQIDTGSRLSKSPQVVTGKIQKDGRTKLLTSTPRRKKSLLLISKSFLC